MTTTPQQAAEEKYPLTKEVIEAEATRRFPIEFSSGTSGLLRSRERRQFIEGANFILNHFKSEGEQEAVRYVWLNMNDGTFSNSWDETQQRILMGDDGKYIEGAGERGWKLIKYTCLTDEKFELYNMMKLK